MSGGDKYYSSAEYRAAAEAEAREDRKIAATFQRRIRKAVMDAAPRMSMLGDGNCGGMIQTVVDELRAIGAYRNEAPGRGTKQKSAISRHLSKAVFERDGYRCVMCASHIDLCCDHIISEHDGGPTTIDNLQTMCRPCNSTKGKKSYSALRMEPHA
ncbi:MAG: hypothetical protein JWP44_4369 [Mucilaginibacter sp.]|nr:hypothetical protein [Mucilaginibacter sp.]